MFLFRPKGRDLQGRGTFLITGFLIPSDWNVIASLAFFMIFRGALTNYQPNVMRRRFTAIRHHTDCTCRSIFGRRNRYVPSVQMIPNRNAVHEDRTLGHGGAFRFLYPIPTTHLPYGRRAIELFISLFDKKRHFYPSALRPFFITF